MILQKVQHLNYARCYKIVKPLSDLLRRGHCFKFGKREAPIFNEVEKILSKKPVLQLYNKRSIQEIHRQAFGIVLYIKKEIIITFSHIAVHNQ